MQDIKDKYEEGQVLLVNKPLHWTSFDVVRKIRNTLKIKKVGHAGTLDPLATGLLIVCTGKFTKKINEYMAQEKEYTGTITLGATTPSYDLETEPENFKPVSLITEEMIRDAAKQFVGEIMQVPPIYSAIKKEGKRAYDQARKGIEVVMEPRKIIVKAFEIFNAESPSGDSAPTLNSNVPAESTAGADVLGEAQPVCANDAFAMSAQTGSLRQRYQRYQRYQRCQQLEISFRVVCSTGTYIRSLANDLGAALGCGGYLSSLCRTRIGAFTLQSEGVVDPELKLSVS